jgi:hypothetical protein
MYDNQTMRTKKARSTKTNKLENSGSLNRTLIPNECTETTRHYPTAPNPLLFLLIPALRISHPQSPKTSALRFRMYWNSTLMYQHHNKYAVHNAKVKPAVAIHLTLLRLSISRIPAVFSSWRVREVLARARSAVMMELRTRRFRSRAVEQLRSEIRVAVARPFDPVAASCSEPSEGGGVLSFSSLVDGRDITSACSVSSTRKMSLIVAW